MTRFVSVILTAACCLGTAVPAFAGYSSGGGFTAPGYGARAWGMGGAAVAFGSDEAATYWNPALLSLIGSHRIGLAYVDLVPGAEARNSFLAYAGPLKQGDADTPGLGFASHAMGALYGNLVLELSDGQKYMENSLLLAYSYSPEYFVSFGVGMDVFFSSSDVGGFDAKGTSFTAGLRLALTPRISVGLVARNVFSRILFDSGGDDELDRSFTLGAAYTVMDDVVIEGDLVGAFGGLARAVAGCEGRFFSDVLAVRAGISAVTAGENRALPHAGMGVLVRKVQLDYNANFDSGEAFGTTHRFSLAVAF